MNGNRPWLVDFTSALYLGLDHSSERLGPWRWLTSGRPAALQAPAGEAALGRGLCRSLGTEAALAGRSTLHLFHDLAALRRAEGAAVVGRRSPLLLDAGVYPIADWAFAAEGPRRFAHHDPAALEVALARQPAGRSPWVVTDGVCPRCGAPAPLDDYLAGVRRHGGLLVVDDTQGVGLLGDLPRSDRPWGRGGGGTARWLGIEPRLWPELVIVASLAKAYGAPLAVVAGSLRRIHGLRESSPARVHASPPTAADMAAASRALKTEAEGGDSLRRRLLTNVRRLRRHFAELGLAPRGPSFPVQLLPRVAGISAAEIQRRLAAAGVATVLTVACGSARPAVTFLVTVTHRRQEIDLAGAALARAVGKSRAPIPRRPLRPVGRET